MELKIKEEFRKLIPSLTDDEYKWLSGDLNQHGCFNPIKTWNGFIVDGHNRYEICQTDGIEFKVEELEFDSEDEAKLWIIDSHSKSRHLSIVQRMKLELIRKDILLSIGLEIKKEKGREGGLKGGRGRSNRDLPDSGKSLSPPEIIGESGQNDTPKPPSHNTQKEIADRLGIGTTKENQLEILIKNNADDLLTEIEQGKKSVDGAYRKFKKMQEPKGGEGKMKTKKSKKGEVKKDFKKPLSKLSLVEKVDPIFLELEEQMTKYIMKQNILKWRDTDFNRAVRCFNNFLSLMHLDGKMAEAVDEKEAKISTN